MLLANSNHELNDVELKRPFVQSNANGLPGPTRPPNHATHPA